MPPLRCGTCGSLLHGGACTRCHGRIEREDLLRPAPGGPLAEFSTGLELALRGAGLTIRSPRLLGLVLLPLVLNVLLFAVLVYLVVANRDLLRPELKEPWIAGLDWLRALVREAAELLAVLAGIVLAAAGTLLGSAIINAPFLEWLSEAVESLVLGRRDETPVTLRHVWNAWIVPVFQALSLAVLQGALAVVLLLLSFTGFLAPLVFLGGVWMTAVTLCDVVVARKRFPVSARFTLVDRSLPCQLGLALPFAVVPFLLPFGVAGATLAFLRDRASRR